jgi:hypothetical protein
MGGNVIHIDLQQFIKPSASSDGTALIKDPEASGFYLIIIVSFFREYESALVLIRIR